MIINNLNFEVSQGEIVAFLGESGSGKSTLLKLIYGLLDANSGEIMFENEPVTGPKYNLVPGHPEMKFVPQEFDLMDSISVGENVGKYLSNFDLQLKFQTIDDVLEVVKLSEFKSTKPNQLSGGQRQRVAIARALAAKPKVLLLDEPYSHLDQPLKFEIRRNLWNWAKENNCMILLTTHDMQDAFGYSDRIAIIQNGEIVQHDSPQQIKNQPLNPYVASLLGEFNLLKNNHLKWFGFEIPENKQALIYPEEIEIQTDGIAFAVKDQRFRGRDYWLEVQREDLVLKLYTNQPISTEFVNLKINNYRTI